MIGNAPSEIALPAKQKARVETLKGIISENSRRDYVEDRDRLLRGLTLHRSGREPDGRIAQTV